MMSPLGAPGMLYLGRKCSGDPVSPKKEDAPGGSRVDPMKRIGSEDVMGKKWNNWGLLLEL